MELTKQDTQKIKGVAILGMIMLHLFCRLGDLPYTPWIWIGDIPLAYYLGLFGDICVPIYCFCSGYAHFLLKEKHENEYGRLIPHKLFRFLINYWLVVVLFSLMGLLSGNGESIPGSVSEFIGNLLVYRLSYNGAWWFIVTYVILFVLSPLSIRTANKTKPAVLIIISGVIYFVSYLFRFKIEVSMPNAVMEWIWQQLILVGTSQFSYMLGMICKKERWVCKLRKSISVNRKKWCVALILLLLSAFIGHCLIQSLIVAPFTAATVLLVMFTLDLPFWLERFLLLMGKHSTNIWLIHMFFYLTLFEGFVFLAKYPSLVFLTMLVVCIAASFFINLLYKSILKGFENKV